MAADIIELFIIVLSYRRGNGGACACKGRPCEAGVGESVAGETMGG
jgi:hypothetical protein